VFKLAGKFREVLDVCEEGVVVLEPELEEADDAADHGEFALVGVREVDLDMVFAEVGVDPHEDFALVVEEDHVFIDDEVPVVVGETAAGSYYGLRVPQATLSRTQFLDLGDWLVVKRIHPYFLLATIELAHYDPGHSFDAALLAAFEPLQLLLRLYRHADADPVALPHNKLIDKTPHPSPQVTTVFRPNLHVAMGSPGEIPLFRGFKH
jgi:hypothetical protein